MWGELGICIKVVIALLGTGHEETSDNLMPALEDYTASQEAPRRVGGETSRRIHSFIHAFIPHTFTEHLRGLGLGYKGEQERAGAYLHDAYSLAERMTDEKIAASPASRPVPVT